MFGQLAKVIALSNWCGKLAVNRGAGLDCCGAHCYRLNLRVQVLCHL